MVESSGFMTAGECIRAEIGKKGPIPFERFMELALYAPGCGYYTRERDPFGRAGDFYTAEQLQPVFGMLIAQFIRPMLAGIDARTVVEPGAGRAEMGEQFGEFEYIPVDREDAWPEMIRGVVFSNELLDALPVHLVKRTRSGWREVAVTTDGDRFVYARRTRTPGAEVLEYLERYHANAPVGSVVEVNLRARRWIERWTESVREGYAIIIDYGYTSREWLLRHAHGTLMSYHRHTASDEVLADPGERDITAHVAWSAVQDHFVEHGWRIESFESLASALMRAGTADQFASLFEGCDAKDELRRRMQLKTLLFGMGETFRVLRVAKPGANNGLAGGDSVR